MFVDWKKKKKKKKSYWFPLSFLSPFVSSPPCFVLKEGDDGSFLGLLLTSLPRFFWNFNIFKKKREKRKSTKIFPTVNSKSPKKMLKRFQMKERERRKRWEPLEVLS